MSATGILDGHHALVTGAGSGIGAAIARSLALAGAQVSLAGRRRSPLEEVAATLPRGMTCVLDGFHVTDPGAIARGVHLSRAEFGPFSILVNI